MINTAMMVFNNLNNQDFVSELDFSRIIVETLTTAMNRTMPMIRAMTIIISDSSNDSDKEHCYEYDPNMQIIIMMW